MISTEIAIMPENLVDEITSTGKKHLLILRKANQHFAVKIMDIAYAFTENKIAFVVDKNGTRYMADKNLSELEQILDHHFFFRANRKFIVNAFFIKRFQSIDRVKLKVDMEVNQTKADIIVSQLTASSFKKWIHTL